VVARDPQHAAASGIAEFTRYVRDRRGVSIPDGDYAALHAWSVRDLAGFWSAVAEFVGVRFHQAPAAVLGVERMPGAEWFPGATLNYAEHVLSPGPGRGDGDVAVVFAREDGLERQVTRAELRDLVGRAGPGWCASVWAAATGWWRWCRTAWRPWRLSSPRRAWVRCSRRVPRTSAPARCETGSLKSSLRC
jgi:hypothetical protein